MQRMPWMAAHIDDLTAYLDAASKNEDLRGTEKSR
jgi:hypothetical protein